MILISYQDFILKLDYKTLFKNEKNECKYLVLDLSWASIHAGISILNYYTFAEYNQRMFDYSKLKKAIPAEKTILISCIIHTMNRFSKAL